MDQGTLVEAKIDAAAELLRELDAAGLPPKFAAWYLYDDANAWRFLLASPALDPLLPKQESLAYRRVIDVLSKMSNSSLSVSELKVVPTSDRLPASLRMFIGTEPNTIGRIDCQNNMFNGIFVKHVVILRSA